MLRPKNVKGALINPHPCTNDIVVKICAGSLLLFFLLLSSKGSSLYIEEEKLSASDFYVASAPHYVCQSCEMCWGT